MRGQNQFRPTINKTSEEHNKNFRSPSSHFSSREEERPGHSARDRDRHKNREHQHDRASH